jgi:2-oxoglutarate dehydrogenase complex dehydrogenase (E1) component-like enzyme
LLPSFRLPLLSSFRDSMVHGSRVVRAASILRGSAEAELLAYRFRADGHRFADLDPLERGVGHLGDLVDAPRAPSSPPRGSGLGSSRPPPPAWLTAPDGDALRAAYCGTLAIDMGAVSDDGRKAWLSARLERRAAQLQGGATPWSTVGARRQIMRALARADALEATLACGRE